MALWNKPDENGLTDDDKLKSMAAEGKTRQEIADALGRTVTAVNGRGHTLGIQFSDKRQRKEFKNSAKDFIRAKAGQPGWTAVDCRDSNHIGF